MDGPAHLLSLKVMRVSRPAIASAWQPFYSSSPSLSVHSTASVVSLQGKSPLPGHPKTLRDLTHATELLTLPSSFGAIQLGETFSSCLCVNNEANVDIESVTLKVDMQTASTKVQLTEFGGPGHILATGDTLENVVHHEIKELGQHVLACTVTYRLPPHVRHAPGPSEDASDPTLQTFRKFYKFAVTNPLSVKTKVHIPRSPTALLSATECEKIFLEIHIQNLTPEPMWFERMSLEAVDGWTVEDDNVIDTGLVTKSVFSESAALMQPQDMRQYVYTMTPILTPSLHVVLIPGAIVPLGRLDISWRSSFGEPGRLLTSMLSRRIPLPPSVHAVSAVPSYLQRNATMPSNVPPRPSSPQHVPSRSGTPPIRPGSPFRSRTGTPSISTRPQSPGPATPHPSAATSQVALNASARPADLEVNLVIRHIPRDSITIEKPFTITCKVNVSAYVPSSRSDSKRSQRVISLVVQHVQPRQVSAVPAPESASSHPDTFSPQLPSALVSASPILTPSRGGFSFGKPFAVSPERFDIDGHTDRHGGEMARNVDLASYVAVLPPPFTDGEGDVKMANSKGILFLGSSAIHLEPIWLSGMIVDEKGEMDDGNASTVRAEAAREFNLSYVPLVKGFSSVGGLRIILVGDQLVEEDQAASNQADSVRGQPEVRILKEWDVIAEIWVKT